MSSSPDKTTPGPRGPRSVAVLAALAVCTALVFVGLLTLGTWQIERRAWKLELMVQVAQRVQAPAVAAPPPTQWPQIQAATDAYRHIHVTGTFLYQHTSLVQASTELGSGFWVLTPLQVTDGSVVLVNRGFVPTEARTRVAPGPATATVTGLLRITEPGGAFLRRNDPAAKRWYSRDVQAIAAAHGLAHVAPYFLDADALQAESGAAPAEASVGVPVGGLTVVRFQNNHLVYAITWYLLALMVAGATWYVVREERRLRRQGQTPNPMDTQRNDATQD